MRFQQGQLYHIYNRSINNEKMFVSTEDYLNFLIKMRIHLLPVCDILAWCLMPNQFHFMVHTNEHSIISIKIGGNVMPQLSFGIKQLLSLYTKALNRKINRTGNLFQQKTKAKLIPGEDLFSLTVFHYIHQNPWRAGLVSKIEDWKFSSFPDYIGLRKGKLINKPLAAQLLDLCKTNLAIETYKRIPKALLQRLNRWE